MRDWLRQMQQQHFADFASVRGVFGSADRKPRGAYAYPSRDMRKPHAHLFELPFYLWYATDMKRTYQFRLYPNTRQEQTLCFWLRRCCALYNACLEESKAAWTMQGQSLSAFDQINELPD